ncbi:hypothetical protein ATH33_1898 [Thermoactinomyces vulgaris]|jgi:hypothetical protein|nr:hypothetical protein ATH33_1898 [Thermoactinomyces vulgaris]
MDRKIKSLLQEGINLEKENVIQHFRYLLQYPFHPDTTFILLEVRGDGGDFGISISPMSGFERQLSIDANGEELKLGGAPFIFHAFEKLEQKLSPEEFEKLTEDDELVGDMDDYVKDYFVTFFQECFNKAGGKKSKLPYYLGYTNGDVYDLSTEKWIDFSVE